MEEEDKAWCNRIREGQRVRVARGRKVPIGTEGIWFWSRSGQYGTRVGVQDDQGEKHWTYAKNLEACVNKPEEMSWTEYRASLEAAEKAKRAKLPQKGELVVVLEGERTGKIGTVFWADGTGRAGVGFGDKPARGKWVDIEWYAAEQLEVQPRT